MSTAVGLGSSEDRAPAMTPLFVRPAFAVTCGALLALLLTLPKALDVLSTGVFLNPDDALRAVELRDFMAGQGWFDLVPHRLSPDHPFIMHWSRLLDLPLAAMVSVFRLVLPGEAAERAMRLVEPILLLVLSLATLVGLARRLLGPASMLPAALLSASSVEFVGNYLPGGIHHHNIQDTLLLGATKLLVDALEGSPDERIGGRFAVRSVGSGVLAGLSLGIGLQNLPFVVGLAAAAVLDWVIRGRACAATLRGFGMGLAGTSIGVFLLDVPPGHYATGACDAFSAAHLIAACACGLVFMGLAATSSIGGSRVRRLALAAAAGLLVVASVALTYPNCLGDPMHEVDSLLKSRWLADVGEALSLATLIGKQPLGGTALFVTLVAGFAATTAAAMHQRRHRSGWLVLAVLCTVGFAGTLWQVRVAAPTGALMIPGVTWAVLNVFRRVARHPGRPALLAAIVTGLVGNGTGLAAAATAIEQHRFAGDSAPPRTLSAGDPASCFRPESLANLAALPPGLVLSTIDPGSAMLAFTHHAVLAAPYHRNTYGNRVALLAFDADPAAAEPIIREARATYVAICRASNETAESARLHPTSLAAVLLAGRPPNWLVSVEPTDGLYRLYRVKEEPASQH